MSAFGQVKQPFFFIIDFNGINCYVYTPEEAVRNRIFYNVNGKTNYSGQFSDLIKNEPVNLKISPVSFEKYNESFTHVKNALQHGDTYLLNLTFRTPIEINLTLPEIFVRSQAKYKLYFDDQFVIFSPERFIHICGNNIETRPMKGTIPASIPNAEYILKSDYKEIYEHNTIVDLLRNDLNIVSENVTVEDFRYLDRIQTHQDELLQISSLIRGELPDNYDKNIGQILSSLLPAGSVTGAPKEKTIQLINEIENYKRGFYTGIFGYYDGSEIDVAVSIRFIEKEGSQLFFKSGGGITALSQVADEYKELINKIYVPIF